MRKLTLASVILIAGMLLAACSSNASNNEGKTLGTQGASVEGTVVSNPAVGTASGAANGVGGAVSTAAAPLETNVAQPQTGTTPLSTQVVQGTQSTGLFATGTPLTAPGIGSTINTPTSSASVVLPTATSSIGQSGVPVTGVTNPDMVLDTQLLGFTVQDSSGQPVGTVKNLAINMQNAAVCGASSASNGVAGSMGTATPTAGISGFVTTATPIVGTTGTTTQSSCSVAGNSTQQNGEIAYIIVDRSNLLGSAGPLIGTSTPSAMGTAVNVPPIVVTPTVTGTVVYGQNTASTAPVLNSTPSATATNGTSATTVGDLVAVPWSKLSFNLSQHVVIVNASASQLQAAPGFSSANPIPDLFGSNWSTQLNSYWNSLPSTSSGNQGGTMIPYSTPTP